MMTFLRLRKIPTMLIAKQHRAENQEMRK